MLIFRPTGVPLWLWRRNLWLIFLVISSEFATGAQSEFSYESITAVLARINISYIEPVSQTPRSISADIGRFSKDAIGAAAGVLLLPRPPANATSRERFLQGCVPNWAPVAEGQPWVALIIRGGCPDEEKVRLAMAQNASAVLLFGGDPETVFPKDPKFKENAIVVYLMMNRGHQLSSLLVNGTKVYISIARGQDITLRITTINRTSVLFVSVSFIVLMVVSLAWLIFYYIQRFRYISAKDKLARQLNNTAKKALAKIPVTTLKIGDKELEETESCAVCIELYQPGDSLRSLPCKHHFHKSCVDPWLLEHRTCPMCKMDILKYYGYISNEGGSSSGSDSVDETVALEAGGGRRGRDSIGSSRGRGRPQEPLQVSVISNSEVLPHIDLHERPPSSNPGGDGLLATPPCHTSCLGTTPGVFRSMILSVRPQSLHTSQETQGAQCESVVEEPTSPPAQSIFEDRRASLSWGPAGENKSSNTPSLPVDSALPKTPEEPAAVHQTPSPPPKTPEKTENQASSASPSLEVLPHQPQTPTTTKTPEGETYQTSSPSATSSPPPTPSQVPPEEEFPDVVVVVSPKKLTSLPRQLSIEKEDYIVYDIECLVREISDLEREEKSDKNEESSATSPSQTPSDNRQSPQHQHPAASNYEGGTITQPASARILNPNIQPELSKVDCNPATQLSLSVHENSSAFNHNPMRITRSISSPPTNEDSEESGSSHIVTISHS